MTTTIAPVSLTDADSFIPRHVGPTDDDVRALLDALGYESLDDFIDATVPEAIRLRRARPSGD